MCEKTTKMYKLVRHQSSMESSHIMERVGGEDCSGLLALRKKEIEKKLLIKKIPELKRIYSKYNLKLKFTNFDCSIFSS